MKVEISEKTNKSVFKQPAAFKTPGGETQRKKFCCSITEIQPRKEGRKEEKKKKKDRKEGSRESLEGWIKSRWDANRILTRQCGHQRREEAGSNGTDWQASLLAT